MAVYSSHQKAYRYVLFGLEEKIVKRERKKIKDEWKNVRNIIDSMGCLV